MLKDQVLWEVSLIDLSCLVGEFPTAGKFKKGHILKFLQIIESIMNMQHKLYIFKPGQYLLRFHISRLGFAVKSLGERTRDRDL